MNSYQAIVWVLVFAIAFLLLIGRLIRDAKERGRVYPPEHIMVSEMYKHDAQDVYNWVVYVTRMIGPRYLDQLAWDRGHKHDFLLSDLRTVLHARTEEERLERLKEIGASFNLDTRIVDEIF